MREPNPQVGSTGLRHSDDATDPAQSRGHSRLTRDAPGVSGFGGWWGWGPVGVGGGRGRGQVGAVAQKGSASQPGYRPMPRSGTFGCWLIRSTSRVAQLLCGDTVVRMDWMETSTG